MNLQIREKKGMRQGI